MHSFVPPDRLPRTQPISKHTRRNSCIHDFPGQADYTFFLNISRRVHTALVVPSRRLSLATVRFLINPSSSVGKVNHISHVAPLNRSHEYISDLILIHSGHPYHGATTQAGDSVGSWSMARTRALPRPRHFTGEIRLHRPLPSPSNL